MVKKPIDAARRPGRAPFVLAVVLAVAGAAAAPASGCAWLRWRELALTHVELLERSAVDAVETFVARPDALAPGDIERLRYPLTRAQAFAHSSRGRFRDAHWLRHFEALLADYGALVGWLDKARTRKVTARGRARARAFAERVRAHAAHVRGDLDAGER